MFCCPLLRAPIISSSALPATAESATRPVTGVLLRREEDSAATAANYSARVASAGANEETGHNTIPLSLPCLPPVARTMAIGYRRSSCLSGRIERHGGGRCPGLFSCAPRGPIFGPAAADGSRPRATTTGPGNARDLARRRPVVFCSSLGLPKLRRAAQASGCRKAPMTHLRGAHKPGRFAPPLTVHCSSLLIES